MHGRSTQEQDMNAIRTLGLSTAATVVVTLLFATSAAACEESRHRLGDHPAVVVQRLHKAAGYDYASKFYPHPAGLRLYAAPPRDAADGVRAAGASAEAKLSAERAVEREPAAAPIAGVRDGG
jgi:hypothetical protein